MATDVSSKSIFKECILLLYFEIMFRWDVHVYTTIMKCNNYSILLFYDIVCRISITVLNVRWSEASVIHTPVNLLCISKWPQCSPNHNGLVGDSVPRRNSTTLLLICLLPTEHVLCARNHINKLTNARSQLSSSPV